MQAIDSETWLQMGTMYFCNDPVRWRFFLEGKGPLPECQSFSYWCSNCEISFDSAITPKTCPNGCKAEDIEDRVILTHKSHTAATFPFATNQKPISREPTKGVRVMRRHKYGVSPKEQRTVDGIVFDSKAEMKRYNELKLMERNGDIRDLRLQPQFDCVVNGIKVCFYKADFWYWDCRKPEGIIVEDVKGCRKGAAYSMFRLKAKLVEALHGIEITEV